MYTIYFTFSTNSIRTRKHRHQLPVSWQPTAPIWPLKIANCKHRWICVPIRTYAKPWLSAIMNGKPMTWTCRATWRWAHRLQLPTNLPTRPLSLRRRHSLRPVMHRRICCRTTRIWQLAMCPPHWTSVSFAQTWNVTPCSRYVCNTVIICRSAQCTLSFWMFALRSTSLFPLSSHHSLVVTSVAVIPVRRVSRNALFAAKPSCHARKLMNVWFVPTRGRLCSSSPVVTWLHVKTAPPLWRNVYSVAHKLKRWCQWPFVAVAKERLKR